MSDLISASLRDQIRRRAAFRCEYCLLHEEDARLPHEPDHVIASKHGGPTRADNLAWACFACNRFKGSDISSIDPETGQLTPLFNPRSDDGAVHFRLAGANVLALTAAGRVTMHLLRLNQEKRVRVRQLLIAAGRYPR